jgi:hypothetical protein
MMDGIADMSPRAKARMAGVFYLLTVLGGILAEGFISGSLVVSGDAAATATNIQTHASLFRLGFTVYMIEMACQITLTALLYQLLKPVSKSVALLAAVFSLVGCTIKTLSRLFYYAPLLVLGGAPYLSVFDAKQLQALALLFLKVNGQGAAIALVFFGLEALLNGYLILKSTFLPRALGVLGIVGGLGWLTFLSPPLGYRLFLYVAAVGILGSLATIVWLLVFGVNEERWKAQARLAAASMWK